MKPNNQFCFTEPKEMCRPSCILDMCINLCLLLWSLCCLLPTNWVWPPWVIYILELGIEKNSRIYVCIIFPILYFHLYILLEPTRVLIIYFCLANVVENKVSKRYKIVTYYGRYGIHKINSLYGLLLANHSMYCALSPTQVIGLGASHVLRTSRFLAKLR